MGDASSNMFTVQMTTECQIHTLSYVKPAEASPLWGLFLTIDHPFKNLNPSTQKP